MVLLNKFLTGKFIDGNTAGYKKILTIIKVKSTLL